MAVERLNTLLSQLVAEVPFGHPDREYLERLRERNALYTLSATRESSIHDYEGRKIAYRSMAERRKIIDGVFPVVSETFGIETEKITGSSRVKEVMSAKFAASYLLHMVGNLGATEIARMYGGRDHTTILNHILRARGLIETDILFSEAIVEAEDKLRQLAGTSDQ